MLVALKGYQLPMELLRGPRLEPMAWGKSSRYAAIFLPEPPSRARNPVLVGGSGKAELRTERVNGQF